MSIRKISRQLLVIVLILIVSASVSFAAGESGKKTVLTVGTEKFSEAEALLFILGSASGNEMMAMLMLSQSSLEDRRQVMNQIADTVLFAQAARDEKLDQQTDIALQIRWQTIQTLVQEYFARVSGQWDMSREAAVRYYNAHRAEFTQNEAVKASHILTEDESTALTAALEALTTGDFAGTAATYSRDPNTAQHGGDLGWVEKGVMVAAVEDAIMNGKPGQIVGPVQSDFGWHIIKIEERRPAKQLSFEEAQDKVMNAMQTVYVEQKIAELRAKHPVTVDDEALRTLGGIPAPEPSPAK